MVAKEIIISPIIAAESVPVIGDDLAQIGRAVNILVNCDGANTELMIYAAFQNLPTLIGSLVKPEFFDVDIDRGRHRKRKGRGLRFFIDFLTQGDLKTFHGPDWRIFRLGEWAQRLGWYMLVLDATSDFVVNWTTMAYQWNGCDLVPDAPRFRAASTNIPVYSTLSGWRTIIGNPWLDGYRTHPGVLAGHIVVEEDCFPRFTLEFSPMVWPGNPDCRFYGTRIRRSDMADPVWTFDTDETASNGVGPSLGTTPGAFMPAGTEVWLEANQDAGGIGYSVCDFRMYSSDIFQDYPLGPDP